MEKPILNSERIFVVDDNPNNLGVVAEYLKSAGYRVSVAPNGSVALERAAGIKPAVILLDVKMPDINGFDVCRQLKKRTDTADIPVIFLTALDDPQHITQGFKAGGTDYLSKPVNKEELLARVKTHVENYLYKKDLQQQVALRTAELEESNQLLKLEIDRRKEVEAKLRHSQERLDLALHSANDGIWDWDLASGALFFDTRYYTMAGYEPNAFPSTFEQWEKRVHCEDIDSSKKAISDYLAGITDSFEAEFRFKRGEGTYMWIRGKGKIVARDDRGNPVRFIGTHSDITESKVAEEELQKAKRLISNIINSMPSSLIGVDVDGRVTQWNNTIELSSGIDAPTAMGKRLSDILPWMASEMNKITESIRTRQVIQEQKRNRLLENELRYEDVTIYPLVTNGIEGAVIRIDDVTHKVRMEEMMIQSEKMLSVGGLAAGMAHEINNPLAGMLQTADVMAKRLSDMDTIPANRKAAESAGTTMEAIRSYMNTRGILRMIDTIKESGQRVATIVENMLSFARKSDTLSSSHDIGELIDKTLELAATDYDLKKKYDFKRIDIVKSYETDMPCIPCESAKIQQVLLNIFQNAAQAMQEDAVEHPRLLIKTGYEKKRDMVFVEIEDNGPGIDETVRKRVFEPFFTTKPVGVGTGLGLSVSYFIITENHHGEMAVESEPGAGAKFVIRLPV